MKIFSFTSHPGFELKISDNRLDFYADNWQLFSFPISSTANLIGAEYEDRDESVTFESEELHEDHVSLQWSAISPAWKKKIYTVCVYKDHVTYDISLSGNSGRPKKIDYFSGGANTPAAKYFIAGYLHCQGSEYDYERAKRFVGSDETLEPGLSSPPPYVFPFFNDANENIIGVGIAAAKGENTYSKINLRYKTEKPHALWIELPYDKGAMTNAEWKSPTIWFGFGKDDFSVIRDYSDWARTKFSYAAPAKIEDLPLWWKKPIYCGWLEQYFLAGCNGDFTKDYATQEHYEAMIKRMDSVGLKPGTIIIDDKWQKDYGTMEPDTKKWHDMRAFADACHASGKHVLLWWRLWSADGLGGDECIQDTGENETVDPTSPVYVARLEKIIHKLLSDEPGCMNVDGFKLDYIYRMPSQNISGQPCENGVAGLELLHRYYETIYKISKKVKPDALINTSVAHPYFGDVFDQIRLHDYNSVQRSTVSIMKFRANYIKAVFPNALLDTDGANFFTGNSQHVHYHNEAAAEIGIPSLYGLETLTDSDLRQIQQVWDEYESKL